MKDLVKSKVSKSRVSKSHSLSRKPGLILKTKRSTLSFTAFFDANRSDDATKATQDTLSMISTPWSTESGFTNSQNISETLWSWTAEPDSFFSTTSVDPLTTTASSSLSSSVLSKGTITLFVASTPCYNHQLFLPITQTPSRSTQDSWTVEMFTSPSMLSPTSRIISVGGAWSPISSDTNFYPCSSDTLPSRKGSRVSVSPSITSSSEYFPTNYINHITLSEEHPGLEWIFAKQHSVPAIISIPI